MSNGNTDSVQALIEQLGLSRHPEGGWYRETWRGDADSGGRASATAIVFLLKSDESSHWHRVDADEMWIWQGGDPLELSIAGSDNGPAEARILGGEPLRGQELQGLVPAGAWQAARPLPSEDGSAGYTLVSCMVVPGFEFDGFELAAPGWSPGQEQAA